jgi:hypothetical protein
VRRDASVLADGFGPGAHRLPGTAQRFLHLRANFSDALRNCIPDGYGRRERDAKLLLTLINALTVHVKYWEELFRFARLNGQ